MTETEAGPDEDGPEYCPVCVRQLVYEVTWADEGGGGAS
jgi:hypothetical protein